VNEFTLADGRKLTWRESGSGPPLILLHGWSMSSAVFAEALSNLSDSFRVLAPDLRGHGGSDGGQAYTLDALVADLRLWVEHLDLEPAALAGWSLGGELALRWALDAPQCFSRLLLLSTTPKFVAGDDWAHGLPPIQLKAMGRDLRRNYLLTMNGFFNLQFEGEALSRERHREIVTFAVRGGNLPEAEVAIESLKTLQQSDLRGELSQLTLPTLVLHGSLDKIIPLGAGRFLAEAIPQARLLEFPTLGHAPFLSDPQGQFRLWREFLV